MGPRDAPTGRHTAFVQEPCRGVRGSGLVERREDGGEVLARLAAVEGRSELVAALALLRDGGAALLRRLRAVALVLHRLEVEELVCHRVAGLEAALARDDRDAGSTAGVQETSGPLDGPRQPVGGVGVDRRDLAALHGLEQGEEREPLIRLVGRCGAAPVGVDDPEGRAVAVGELADLVDLELAGQVTRIGPGSGRPADIRYWLSDHHREHTPL